MTNPDAFRRAAEHHLAGRLPQAEAAYRALLAADPTHAEATHLLGLCLFAQGDPPAAAAMVEKAIALEPNRGPYYVNLAMILTGLGRLDDAVRISRQGMQIQPNMPDAHNNLGIALAQSGQIDEAITEYSRAVQIKPDYAEAYNNLANALCKKGDTAQSIIAYRQAVRLNPAYAEAHSNLGNALRETGDTAASIASHQTALKLKPNWATGHFNLARALFDAARRDEALHAYYEAIRLNPDFFEAHHNLGVALQEMGQIDAALSAHHKAIALRPDSADVYYNLGRTLNEAGRFTEAAEANLHAIKLKPDHAQAYNNLGNIYKNLGRLDDALAAYERAKELDPNDPLPQSNLAYVILFHPAFDAPAQLERAREFGRKWTFPTQTYKNDRSLRRLKIGYVSPDFNRHCQNFFTRPLFAHHDPEKVEIFCYSDVIAPDAVTEELRAKSHHWRDITNHTDQSVADLIRRDQIDILVDLTLHMSRNRLLVFARKPAPIQATWLGYPGTTGLETIDYRLTDPYLDPPGTDHLYTEKSLRLPDTFWCYDPGPTPDVTPLPMLKNGFVTFGSLNNYAKVNDAVLDLWQRVLDRVPHSKLILLTPPGDHRESLRQRFGDKLTMVEHRPREKYLDLYGQIDICLDTLPYNGHTTSLDAYFMGVPVVTLIGQTVVGRAGWSQLNNLGLTELAAHTPDQFVQIAASLTENVGPLRQTLRDRMRQSPLMDARKFARNIEDAYQTMWRAWISQ